MRQNIIITIVVVYLIGFVLANKLVRDSCTHHACKHGWNSKYNAKEKRIASAWIIGFPLLAFFFVEKVFPERPNRPLDRSSKHVSHKRSRKEYFKPTSPHAPSEDPICQKCGFTMKLRIAKRGAHIGNEFWGCSNYPRCKNIVNKTS